MPKHGIKLHLRTSTMSIPIWDVVTIVMLLIPTLYTELSDISPFIRPIDLADPSIGYPQLKELVPTRALLTFCILFPLIVLFLSQGRKLRQSPSLIITFLFSILEILVLTILITNIFKLIIGRPRPYFASVCKSYTTSTSFQCTGDADAVREARKSFPSGHSSTAFSICVFVTLFLYTEFSATQRLQQYKPKLFINVILLTPIVMAGLVASSRIIDFHHHYADVIAGAALGTTIAIIVFSVRKIQLVAELKRNERERLLPTQYEPELSLLVQQQPPQT